MARLIRARKAAEVLDVPPRRIYTLIERGVLEAVRLGPRQLRVKASSLDRLSRSGIPKADVDDGKPAV